MINAITRPIHLKNTPLLAARVVWFVLAALAVGFYVAMAPINLRTIAGEWQVSESYPVVAAYLSRQGYATYVLLLRYLVLLLCLAVGCFVFWRRSRDWTGLLVSLTLVIMPVGFNLAGYTEHWSFYYDAPWDAIWQNTRTFLALGIGPICYLGVAFLFPNGRFAPRWFRWVAAAALLGVVAFVWPMALGAGGFERAVVTFLTFLMTGVASQIYRYRFVSTAEERGQTRWAVLGLVAFGLLWPLALLVGGFLPPRHDAAYRFVDLHLSLFAMALLPLTIALSMLRYQLWEVDRVVNRTLVYGALSVVVAALYVLAVGSLGTLFQLRSNLVVATLATGLVAVLFHPLRRRMQQAVNRFMYGERDDPHAVLNAVGQQLQNAVAPDTLLPTVVETVAQSLRLPYCAIVIKPAHPGGAEGTVAAAWGEPVGAPLRFPLTYQAAPVGELLVAPRSEGEPLHAADRRLLEAIAHQAGAAAYAVRVTSDLQHSRERLVVTREEERRRLRRDLHDGLGPQLASLTLKLDAARNLLAHNPEAAERLLVDLKTQTQATIADVRRLVYGLRPPALDQLGLVSALREYVNSRGADLTFAITIAAKDVLPPLPAAVEVAAFRIVMEALTNVERHAQARACLVRFALEGNILRIEVEDNGAGFAEVWQAGVGVNSMRERAEELGGWLRIDQAPAGGTVVRAALPLPSVPARAPHGAS